MKERFLRYIAIDTESDDTVPGQIPSTKGQWTLANLLVEELKELGAEDAYADEFCTVYAHFAATEGMEEKASFGCIAHMDTVLFGKDIKPRVIDNYDGKDVELEDGTIMEVSRHPELPGLKGRSLIVTDGTTILGADDKAGIAAIMGMCEKLSKEAIPHGRVCVAFTPDEEVGNGVTKFNLEKFGADYAVTVDGGSENAIEYENFNAASVKIEIKGIPAHPGSAKGTMINAAKLLYEYHSMLPEKECPELTEGKEGFYHLMHLEGAMAKAGSSYIIREFDQEKYEYRKEFMKKIGKQLNQKYGKDLVSVSIEDSYFNMAQVINQYPQILLNIEQAIKNAGMTPEYFPIRGGTDGCRLSFMGLPCPNLGAGGYGFHGKREHCTVEGMENSAQVLYELVKIYSGMEKAAK